MFPALTVLVAKKLLEIIGDVKRYLNEAIFKISSQLPRNIKSYHNFEKKTKDHEKIWLKNLNCLDPAVRQQLFCVRFIVFELNN